MSRDPLLYVADIVAAGEAILRYTDGVAFDAIGSNDEKRSDVERQVFIFSEAAALLPEEWKLQPIEQQYRDLKDELGWDHFEGRTFRGWNHHVVLTAIGFTFLQLEPRRAPNAGPPTLPRIRFWQRDHGDALHRQPPPPVESRHQLPAGSSAENLTK